MPEYHDIVSFLNLRSQGMPILDVRSPSEFAAGHIAGAQNLPLFTDEERAAVGTAHAKSGCEAAVHLGLSLIGPQLAAKLSQARRLTGKKREVLLYCWRGGMRSGSMAWLLELGGYTVHLLQGGYKAYRHYIREQFGREAKILILGGMTGSGKTDILHELAKLGSQVLDLEKIAGHRGSAFGGVGLPPQPTNEQVENALYEEWKTFDFSRPIWLEDENRLIGKVALPDTLFQQILHGQLVLVNLPLPLRIARLEHVYADIPDTEALTEALIQALDRIRLRLGNARWQECVTAVREKRYTDVVRQTLIWYDKAYNHLLEKTQRQTVLELEPTHDDPVNIAKQLVIEERNFF